MSRLAEFLVVYQDEHRLETGGDSSRHHHVLQPDGTSSDLAHLEGDVTTRSAGCGTPRRARVETNAFHTFTCLATVMGTHVKPEFGSTWNSGRRGSRFDVAQHEAHASEPLAEVVERLLRVLRRADGNSELSPDGASPSVRERRAVWQVPQTIRASSEKSSGRRRASSSACPAPAVSRRCGRPAASGSRAARCRRSAAGAPANAVGPFSGWSTTASSRHSAVV